MTFDAAFVLGVTFLAIVAFVREDVPAHVVGLGAAVALVATGIVRPLDALAAFGNGAVVTVGACFVLAAGLTRSGAVEPVGAALLRVAGSSPTRALVALMTAASLLSAFLNNTPLAVILLPVAIGLAERTGVAASRLLIPMSYATITGGMCTLIGTSTNVLVSADLARRGLPALGMFEPLPLAVAGSALSILYMATLGRRLLPDRPTVAATVRAGKLEDYVTELALAEESSLVGRPAADVVRDTRTGVRVLRVVRGEEGLDPATEGLVLAPGDHLLIRGDAAALVAADRAPGARLAPALRPAEVPAPHATTLVELVVRPGSLAIGATVAELGLHATTGALVVGIQRHEVHRRDRIATLPLRLGDVLLCQADAPALDALRRRTDLLVVEARPPAPTGRRRPLAAVAILGAFLALSASGLLGVDVAVLAAGAALAMILVGGLPPLAAARAIDVRLLVLMATMIVLGAGMSSSGAAQLVANGLVAAGRPFGPIGVLAAVYLATNLLTALVSNAAAALVMLPIALGAAAGIGVGDRPFVIAVLFAASIDFSTPIGYQTNTLVYAAGGYRFADFVRVGTPMNVLWWILAVATIPWLWPFELTTPCSAP